MNWFALIVKPQHEKMVGEQLVARSLEAYVPLVRSRRKWSDRLKAIDTPLFPRYAFCRFSFQDRVPVLRTPGVVKVVGFGGKPTPVSDGEINSIKTMLGSGRSVMPWPLLRMGQKVRIHQGPLCGVEGILAREKSSYRVVVNVELLNRGVAVEVARDEIQPLHTGPDSGGHLGRQRVA